jgi:hypothetical protein
MLRITKTALQEGLTQAKYLQAYMNSKVYHGLGSVAEPPKLYGPHAPVIVLKTSDCCTWEPDNPDSLSSVLGEPRIIHILQLI